MKIWIKITLYSMIVFTIIFNISGVLIIEENHSNMLNQEVESTLSQTDSIYKGIVAMGPVFKIYNDESYTKELLKSYAQNVVYGSGKEINYIEIINDSNEMIYTNIDFKLPDRRIEYDQIKTDEINYILREIEGKTYLFSSISVPVEQTIYRISYVRDLTHLYINRIQEYQFFILLDALALVIYFISMFAVSKSITKPIERMVHSTKVIASGHYNERLQIRTHDEMGRLAHDFNEMAQAIEIKINELAKSNEDKQNFINDFTHELRTPLTSILGYTDFLRKSPYNEELFLEALDTIYNEGKRLETISVKLMNLVLLEKENLPLQRGNLKDVIESILLILEMKTSAYHLNLIVNCEDGEFLMDVDLMKSLIINLVENAIKASQEDHNISIRCESLQNEILLIVEDEGCGISPQHLDKITQPFYMVDEVRTTRNNGLGLGLAICKKIIQLHQGELIIESQIDQGTKIMVKFLKIGGEAL